MEYEDSDRMPGVLTTDMKKNKVTPDMIYNSAVNKTEFEHVGMGKQVPKNLINGNTKENYANALKESRDNLLAHVFNKGNPLGDYECVLDKKALKNGIYKFDDNATKKFLKELSDEKLEKFADKTVKKISKEYFKTHGGETKLREEMEKENSQIQEPVKENVQQEIKKERIEVPEAQYKEVKTEENIIDKEHVYEIQAPENEQEKKL